MKLLSDASEYALRATVWLSQRPGETHKLREIAEGTKATPGYLIKVLQSLARAGIFSTQRGSNGGFSLLRDPKTLTALEVINAVDPIQRIRTCPLGIESHGTCLCPMHRRIDDAMASIEQSFGDTTIAELIEENAQSRPLCDALMAPPATAEKPNA